MKGPYLYLYLYQKLHLDTVPLIPTCDMDDPAKFDSEGESNPGPLVGPGSVESCPLFEVLTGGKIMQREEHARGSPAPLGSAPQLCTFFS